jgi:6-phosphogluconolactonase
VEHDVRVVPDADALAVEAARYVVERARAAIVDRGRFTFAVSGGHTPWTMLGVIASCEVPWERVVIFQVDERVAPAGDDDRNLTHLVESLGGVPARLEAMPVGDDDLGAAAARYGRRLPARFDLVHLGLGFDGHTASLVPGDPVLDVADRPVAVTGEYQGHRRMTLTYPALARAGEILWIVSGASKRDALGRLLHGDRSIPAGRVEASRSTVMADAAAYGGTR